MQTDSKGMSHETMGEGFLRCLRRLRGLPPLKPRTLHGVSDPTKTYGQHVSGKGFRENFELTYGFLQTLLNHEQRIPTSAGVLPKPAQPSP